MTIGEKLAALVNEKHWTQAYVIGEIGQWGATWNRWKSGTATPNVEDLRQIARVLGCDLNWLLDDRLGMDGRPDTASHSHALGRAVDRVITLGPAEALSRMDRPAGTTPKHRKAPGPKRSLRR